MSGAKHRPRRVGENGGGARYYNILFPVNVIGEIRKRAKAMEITGAELVRLAVSIFLKEKR